MLVTTKQAAERIGVTRCRILQLIAAGRLPAEKIGRDWVIEEASLELVADRRAGRPGWAENRGPRP